ncbi:uncharacterized protein LOC103700537 isoform X4 [Phoenix dactylifera]|uniref:Uncharacterized protein LOC103700537 isoform X4 n=1 Tax=Phoenix dactylifera TaxID=42345 RepID=A0A8B9A170_PHODC|nr:uncharacterized protein LOC103700537 isoform X4 [Phoenix dactylifera]
MDFRMRFFSVLAALNCVYFPGDEVNCAEEVEGQLAAEIDSKTRQNCPEVQELPGAAVVVANGRRGAADKIVITGSAECPEVSVSWKGVGRRPVQRSGSRKDSLGSTEDLEDRLGRDISILGVTLEDSDADEHHHSQAETCCGGEDERPTTHIHQNLPEEASPFHDHTVNNPLDQHPDFPGAPTVRVLPEPAGDSRVIDMNPELQHHHSQAEQSYGGEDEHPTPYMLQNMCEEASQYHDGTGNNVLDLVLQIDVPWEPDLSAATTGRGVPEPAENNRDGQREGREVEEEMKAFSKLAYFLTGTSTAALMAISSGYLEGQTGHAHTVALKVCTIFMVVTFLTGCRMLFLILSRSSHISIKSFKSLKWTGLLSLILSVFSGAILYLKMFALLAFFIAMILFFMA